MGGQVDAKAGIIHFHTGPGPRLLKIVHTLLDDFDISAPHLYATHISRSPELLDDAIRLAKRGAFVDIDTVEPGVGKWFRYYLEHDGPPDQLTASSDAHVIDSKLNLYREFQASIRDEHLPLVTVLPFFTRNTANVLRLPTKGQLREGMDADLLVLNRDTFDIVHVFAKGRQVVKDGQVIAEEQFKNN